MKIGIVIGSIREQRVGAAVGQWALAQAASRDADYEIIDLREFDLPMLSTHVLPAMAGREYEDDRVGSWGRAIDSCDGFIFITPEYNHSVPGAMKNAFDCLFPEWWSKAIAFISYGAAFGFRAVEQWRPIVANANMFDVKAQVALSTILHWRDGVFTPADRHLVEIEMLFASIEAASEAMTGLRANELVGARRR